MLKNQTGIGLILILLIVVLVVLVGGGAYFLGSKNAQIPTPSPSPSASTATQPLSTASPSPSPSPSVSPSPKATISPALLENIKASIVSKNTAALEGYMSENVNVVIEASECCGNLTAVEAVKKLDYIVSATEPWNFADNNPITVQLKQKHPQTFPDDAVIGTSDNHMVVAFTLNQNKTKIEKEYMAIDYKLLGI